MCKREASSIAAHEPAGTRPQCLGLPPRRRCINRRALRDHAGAPVDVPRFNSVPRRRRASGCGRQGAQGRLAVSSEFIDARGARRRSKGAASTEAPEEGGRRGRVVRGEGCGARVIVFLWWLCGYLRVDGVGGPSTSRSTFRGPSGKTLASKKPRDQKSPRPANRRAPCTTRAFDRQTALPTARQLISTSAAPHQSAAATASLDSARRRTKHATSNKHGRPPPPPRIGRQVHRF